MVGVDWGMVPGFGYAMFVVVVVVVGGVLL
jgi:hypothetical protein